MDYEIVLKNLLSKIGERKFRLFFGVFLLGILIGYIGLEDLVVVLINVRLGPLLSVVISLIFLFLLGAFNIWLLLKRLKPISFISFLHVYLYAWALSLITPGQAGDASIIFLLRQKGIPLSTTSTAYLVDKFITLILFLCISLVGIFTIFDNIIINYRDFLLSCVVFVIFPVSGIFLFRKFLFLKQIITFAGKIKINFATLQSNRLLIFINSILTFIKWIIVSFAFYLAFLSFGVVTAWPEIGVIPIMSTLVGYLPISFAGIGTVEIAAVYLFGHVGVVKSVVLSAYLLLRVIQFTIAALLLLFFRCIFRWKPVTIPF